MTVAPANVKAARYAVEHWHYSGTLPVPPLVIFGVWERSKFIGVVIFSRGASSALGAPYGLGQTEVCELTRVALNDHEAPVSQIVAQAIKELRKQSPKLKLIVSFADPAEGHHGGIYQAGNWVFAGTSRESPVYFDRSGRKWHSRQVSVKGVNTQFGAVRVGPKTSELRKVMMPGKFRYLMPLNRRVAKQIEKLRQPYPSAVQESNLPLSADADQINP